MGNFFNKIWSSFDKGETVNNDINEVINHEPCEIKEGHIISLSYEEIKEIKNNNKLDTSKLYLLNDFVTTTSQKHTKSAEHRFDILLTPISDHEFSKNVKAMLHENDEYFKKCDLSSWIVRYDFENDRKKYKWADAEKGKGVIFYMKDEFGNECPYDFKNIMFKRWGAIGKNDEKVYYCNVDFTTEESLTEQVDFDKTEFYYTFSTLRYGCQVIEPNSNIPENYTHLWVCDITVDPFKLPRDYSHKDDLDYDFCIGNTIKPLYTKNNILMLNNNVFIGYPSFWKKDEDNYVTYNSTNFTNNTILNDCYGNTFCGKITSNTLENNCSYNIFTENSFKNRLGSGCKVNTFMKGSNGNQLGDDCKENVMFSSSDNILENLNIANVLNDSNCNHLRFTCISNHFSNSSNNFLNVGCRDNELTDASENTFGQYCIGNKNFSKFEGNHLDDECCNNTFGENCHNNILCAKSSMNKFGDDTSFNYFRGNNYYILIENGVSNVEIQSNICGESQDNMLNKNLEPGVFYKQIVYINKENEIKVKTEEKENI